MKFVEEVKSLATDREKRTEIWGNLIGAVLGDPAATVKVVGGLWGLPDQIFWAKMEMFLQGIYSEEKDRERLCVKFEEIGKKEESAFRLISIIDRVESMQKIRYLIRATRCLMDGRIDCPIYFRICHMVMHALEEDLEFLKEHMGDKEFPYSASVQGLLAVGLMYQSVIRFDDELKYSFDPFAGMVYYYALDEGLEADLGSAGKFSKIGNPRTQVELPTATDEDVEGLFR